jgi:hypothetical protein
MSEKPKTSTPAKDKAKPTPAPKPVKKPSAINVRVDSKPQRHKS